MADSRVALQHHSTYILKTISFTLEYRKQNWNTCSTFSVFFYMKILYRLQNFSLAVYTYHHFFVCYTALVLLSYRDWVDLAFSKTNSEIMFIYSKSLPRSMKGDFKESSVNVNENCALTSSEIVSSTVVQLIQKSFTDKSEMDIWVKTKKKKEDEGFITYVLLLQLVVSAIWHM